MYLTSLIHFFWLLMKGQEISPQAKDGSETNTSMLIICPVRKENIKLHAMTLCCFRQIQKFCFLECISNSTPIIHVCLEWIIHSQHTKRAHTKGSRTGSHLSLYQLETKKVSAGIELLLQTQGEI